MRPVWHRPSCGWPPHWRGQPAGRSPCARLPSRVNQRTQCLSRLEPTDPARQRPGHTSGIQRSCVPPHRPPDPSASTSTVPLNLFGLRTFTQTARAGAGRCHGSHWRTEQASPSGSPGVACSGAVQPAVMCRAHLVARLSYDGAAHRVTNASRCQDEHRAGLHSGTNRMHPPPQLLSSLSFARSVARADRPRAADSSQQATASSLMTAFTQYEVSQ